MHKINQGSIQEISSPMLWFFWTGCLLRAQSCSLSAQIPFPSLVTAERWLSMHWVESRRYRQRLRAFERSGGVALQGCPGPAPAEGCKHKSYWLTSKILGNWLSLSSPVETCPFLWWFWCLPIWERSPQHLIERNREGLLSACRQLLRFDIGYIWGCEWVYETQVIAVCLLYVGEFKSGEAEQFCYMESTEWRMLLAFIHMALKIHSI